MKIRAHHNSDIPPLCQCGFGQSVTRNKITREWNKYLHGHNSKSASNSAKFKPGNTFGKGRPEGSRNRRRQYVENSTVVEMLDRHPAGDLHDHLPEFRHLDPLAHALQQRAGQGLVVGGIGGDDLVYRLLPGDYDQVIAVLQTLQQVVGQAAVAA